MALHLLFIALIPLILLSASPCRAEVYSYSPGATVVGSAFSYTIADKSESLIEKAREFGLGYNEMAAANPGIDPFVPGAGTTVLIPRSWVLPSAASLDGIVINLSEMRLYYFFKKDKNGPRLVATFPIGIGTEGNETPLGVFTIIEKMEEPRWHVPASIRKERPDLPAVVPPGPDNPLGSHALRLSRGTVLIHGTNRPWGVGRRVSHGCIRLYPEDIPRLYALAAAGTRVAVVRQPVKAGLREGRVYVEVHDDPEGVRDGYDYYDEAMLLLTKMDIDIALLDYERLEQALREKSGVPIDISGAEERRLHSAEEPEAASLDDRFRLAR